MIGDKERGVSTLWTMIPKNLDLMQVQVTLEHWAVLLCCSVAEDLKRGKTGGRGLVQT